MISVETRYIAPSDPSLPAFALRITRLVDSYMIWIGTTELAPDAVEKAPELGRLCKDWACAMPPKNQGQVGAATSLYRTSTSDESLSMAQRLARRFGKQMLVSVDGDKERMLEMEKAVVGVLKSM
ncbi:hypothetical protein VKT23_000840 [Stygiomarasmius scandens]|uniref:Proteasome assembly chaperone 3 n=1 Tax=Marasmiellus scandens TaxID=2682957 RepID=A0ABR1K8K2_9AGAR